MKKIIINLLGIFPTLILISIICTSVILLLGNLIKSINSSNLINIIEFLFVLVAILYAIRLYGFVTKKMFLLYCVVNLATIIFLFIFQYKVLVLFQLVPVFVFILNYDQRIGIFKNIVYRSGGSLVFFNIFDFLYIIFLYHLKSNEKFWDDFFIKFSTKFNIPESEREMVFYFLFIILFFVILPGIRSWISILVYKIGNQIQLNRGKVLWNKYLINYFVSFLTCTLYSSYVFSIKGSNLNFISLILVFMIPSLVNLYFWLLLTVYINQGGEERDNVLAGWTMLTLIAIFLIFLEINESDLIGILTWFLPVLIPVFIGEVNVIFQSNIQNGSASVSRIPEPTPKMKRHLYWLQLMSFNSLLILNLLSSYKENIAKEKIVELLVGLTGSSIISTFFSRIFGTFIIILISIILAYALSKLIIWLLKILYSPPSKGYFQ